jgi:hypothetical protein
MLHLLWAILIGLVVYMVGTAFDKSPDNHNAGLAGLIAFVLVLLGLVL